MSFFKNTFTKIAETAKDKTMAPVRNFENRREIAGRVAGISWFFIGTIISFIILCIILYFTLGSDSSFIKYSFFIGLLGGAIISYNAYWMAYNNVDVLGKTVAASYGVSPNAYDAAAAAADTGLATGIVDSTFNTLFKDKPTSESQQSTSESQLSNTYERANYPKIEF